MTYVSEVRGVVSDAWHAFTHAVEEIHDSEPFQRYLEVDRKIVSMEQSAWNSLWNSTLKPVDVRRFASSYPSSDQPLVLLSTATVPPVVRSLHNDLGSILRIVRENISGSRNSSRVRLEFLINQVRVFLDKGHYKAAIKELRALRNSFSTRPSLFSKAQPQLDSLIEKVRALNQLATAAQRAARAAREVAEAARAAAPIARAAANAAKPVLDKVAAVPPPAKLVLLVGATLLALGGAAGEAWAMTKD